MGLLQLYSLSVTRSRRYVEVVVTIWKEIIPREARCLFSKSTCELRLTKSDDEELTREKLVLRCLQNPLSFDDATCKYVESCVVANLNLEMLKMSQEQNSYAWCSLYLMAREDNDWYAWSLLLDDAWLGFFLRRLICRCAKKIPKRLKSRSFKYPHISYGDTLDSQTSRQWLELRL
jgi:hypothetical protein